MLNQKISKSLVNNTLTLTFGGQIKYYLTTNKKTCNESYWDFPDGSSRHIGTI